MPWISSLFLSNVFVIAHEEFYILLVGCILLSEHYDINI